MSQNIGEKRGAFLEATMLPRSSLGTLLDVGGVRRPMMMTSAPTVFFLRSSVSAPSPAGCVGGSVSPCRVLREGQPETPWQTSGRTFRFRHTPYIVGVLDTLEYPSAQFPVPLHNLVVVLGLPPFF